MLPVDAHQVHVRFYVVSHCLWDAMSKPHLLKILIAILAQMKRVATPATKLYYVNLYIFDKKKINRKLLESRFFFGGGDTVMPPYLNPWSVSP